MAADSEPTKRPPLLLHVASDYSDGLEGKAGTTALFVSRQRRPTLAINRLVDGADGFDHVVFSLRRHSLPFGLFLRDCGTSQRRNVRLFIYKYFGPPFGVGLFFSLWVVARRIRRVLRDHGLKPDAIHAHRLTFDGIAGWLLARALDVPLFISIRGEVEDKVFKFKPTYRPLLRRIAADAAGIFYVSAWYAPRLQQLTGVDPAKTRLLPNIVEELPARGSDGGTPTTFVTVLNLDIWRKKGLEKLLQAFTAVVGTRPGAQLAIIGRGSAPAVAEVRRLIERLGLGAHVRLEGALSNAEVRRRMSESVALVLPSRNETFGMVYLEALFAGAPILYSKGTGIDGFLDGLDVGIGVDPEDVADIARALDALAERNPQFRQGVRSSASALADRFGRDNVLRRYQEVIRSTLAAWPRAQHRK